MDWKQILGVVVGVVFILAMVVMYTPGDTDTGDELTGAFNWIDSVGEDVDLPLPERPTWESVYNESVILIKGAEAIKTYSEDHDYWDDEGEIYGNLSPTLLWNLGQLNLESKSELTESESACIFVTGVSKAPSGIKIKNLKMSGNEVCKLYGRYCGGAQYYRIQEVVDSENSRYVDRQEFMVDATYCSSIVGSHNFFIEEINNETVYYTDFVSSGVMCCY